MCVSVCVSVCVCGVCACMCVCVFVCVCDDDSTWRMIKDGCVRVFSVDLDKHGVTDKMTEARM